MLNRMVVIFVLLFSFTVLVEVKAVDISNSQAFTYDDGNGNTLLYRLFFPPGYDTPGEEFPLVLYLHGAGSRGTDNLAQVNSHIDGLIEAARTPGQGAFLLAPQVQPSQGSWSALWSPTELAPAMDLTLQVIEHLEQQYQIDSSRRSVTGVSMGGFGTWDIAAKRPDMFTAAAPIAGGGDLGQVANLRDVPIWNFHGRHDNTVLVDLSRNMISALEQAGGSPLYLEINDSHDIADPIYDDPNGDLYSWLTQGIEPPLATLIYNPDTGNLKIDASRAPGGAIDYFFIGLEESFALQPTMTVDGNVVNTTDFVSNSNSKFLGYKNSFAEEFGGIADFGPIMPTGLSSQELHFNMKLHLYTSPETMDETRLFRLIMEVPEPATYLLGTIAAAGFLVARRRRMQRVYD